MPYSEFSNKRNDGTYRGHDRRDSMAYFPEFEIRVPLFIIAGIAAITVAFNVFFPGFLYKALQQDLLYVSSSIALGVAGTLSIIRWRLDAMARSFWYGMAGLVGLAPLLGLGSNEQVATSLLLATVAATSMLSIWALRSEAVDVAP